MKRCILSLIALTSVLVIALLLLGSCSSSKEGSGDKTGNDGGTHTHDFEESVIAPTCTDKGYTAYTCACGETRTDNFVNPTGHTYTASVVAPSCELDGYTSYTCACGDTYTDDTVTALGHSYTYSEVLREPTTLENGLRRYTCEVCAGVLDEAIDAITLKLPKVSDFLGLLLGAITYSASADDSRITYVHESGSIELEGGRQYTVRLEVADVKFFAKEGVPFGHLVTMVKLTDYTKGSEGEAIVTHLFNIELFLEGEYVSLAIAKGGADAALYVGELTEIVIGACLNAIGIDASYAEDVLYLAEESLAMLPTLAGVLRALEAAELPMPSAEAIEGVKNFFRLFGEEIITSEILSDGSEKYEINIDALVRFIDAAEGKTLGLAIDEIFGEGSADSISELIKSIPTLKLREISDKAMSISETYGIDVDDIYSVVNYFVEKYVGEFDVKEEINSRYDMTVAEIVAEMKGALDVTAEAERLCEYIEDSVDTLLAHGIDSAFNVIAPDLGGGEDFSILGFIKQFIRSIDESSVLSVTFGEDGKPVAFTVNLYEVGVSYSYQNGIFEGEVLLPNGDAANVYLDENTFSLQLDGGDGNTLRLFTSGDDTTALVTLTINEKEIVHLEIDGHEFTLTFEPAEGDTVTLALDYNSFTDEGGATVGIYALTLHAGEDKLLDAIAELYDGEITIARILAWERDRGYNSEDSGDAELYLALDATLRVDREALDTDVYKLEILSYYRVYSECGELIEEGAERVALSLTVKRTGDCAYILTLEIEDESGLVGGGSLGYEREVDYDGNTVHFGLGFDLYEMIGGEREYYITANLGAWENEIDFDLYLGDVFWELTGSTDGDTETDAVTPSERGPFLELSVRLTNTDDGMELYVMIRDTVFEAALGENSVTLALTRQDELIGSLEIEFSEEAPVVTFTYNGLTYILAYTEIYSESEPEELVQAQITLDILGEDGREYGHGSAFINKNGNQVNLGAYFYLFNPKDKRESYSIIDMSCRYYLPGSDGEKSAGKKYFSFTCDINSVKFYEDSTGELLERPERRSLLNYKASKKILENKTFYTLYHKSNGQLFADAQLTFETSEVENGLKLSFKYDIEKLTFARDIRYYTTEYEAIVYEVWDYITGEGQIDLTLTVS